LSTGAGIRCPLCWTSAHTALAPTMVGASRIVFSWFWAWLRARTPYPHAGECAGLQLRGAASRGAEGGHGSLRRIRRVSEGAYLGAWATPPRRGTTLEVVERLVAYRVHALQDVPVLALATPVGGAGCTAWCPIPGPSGGPALSRPSRADASSAVLTYIDTTIDQGVHMQSHCLGSTLSDTYETTGSSSPNALSMRAPETRRVGGYAGRPDAGTGSLPSH
jgi:hypothetical protein